MTWLERTGPVPGARIAHPALGIHSASRDGTDMGWDKKGWLLRHPLAAIRSARASALVDGRRSRDLLIITPAGARIDVAPDATLDLAGRLFLGYLPENRKKRRKRTRQNRPIGPVVSGPTALVMAPRSRISTSGWVILGPGMQVVLAAEAELGIGAETYLTGNSMILCRKEIEIGPGCAIGWGVTIMDSDMHWLSIAGDARPHTAPIRIGKRVWVGSNATILKGVTIGDGAVIAAGSVVTSDIPASALAGGVPARVRRNYVEWH